MATLEEAQLAIRAGEDGVGLIGVSGLPESARTIDDRAVAAIAALIPPPIATFLLTSERTAARIAECVLAAGTSAVQIVSRLCPDESERLPELLPATRR